MSFQIGDFVAAPALIPPIKLGKVLSANGTICPWYDVLEIQDNGTVGPRLWPLYEPNLVLLARIKDNITPPYTC